MFEPGTGFTVAFTSQNAGRCSSLSAGCIVALVTVVFSNRVRDASPAQSRVSAA
jgi:hypothetical protein